MCKDKFAIFVLKLMGFLRLYFFQRFLFFQSFLIQIFVFVLSFLNHLILLLKELLKVYKVINYLNFKVKNLLASESKKVLKLLFFSAFVCVLVLYLLI